eukprot:1149977-Pelagomonas_calceolata.AAC.2
MQRAVRTVMVMNLNLRADEGDVFEFFGPRVGALNDIKIIKDKNTKRSKGIAYVEFQTVESAIAALSLNGQLLLNMPVLVKPSEAEKVGGVQYGAPACPHARAHTHTHTHTHMHIHACNMLQRSVARTHTHMHIHACNMLQHSVRARACTWKQNLFMCVHASLTKAPSVGLPCSPNLQWEAQQQAKQNQQNQNAAAGLLTQIGAPAHEPIKLQILNLHPEVKEDDLQELFGPFGTINYLKVVRDATGRSTGEAYVQVRSTIKYLKVVRDVAGMSIAGACDRCLDGVMKARHGSGAN